jgi:hypothetical protein
VVYGGGGGSTGTYLFDYVELHNVSSSSQSLTGFSIQYGSASGNFGSAASNIYAFPAGTSIPAGAYLLIQCGPTGTVGSAFPVAPDLITGNLTISGVSGKVVLSNQAAGMGCGATATLCTLPSGSIVDLVAYGIATNAEGGVSVNNGIALTSTQGSVRKNNGCQDTDNNNADFNVVTAPVPRNSASAIAACGAVGPSLTVTGSLSNFGAVVIGSSSASQTYNLSGANLTGAPGTITIAAPSSDFQVSNDNSTWGATTTLAYTAATLAATPVWVRFSPQSPGPKTGNVSNLGGGVTVAVNVAVSGTGSLPPTPVISAGSLPAFGNVCLNTSAGPHSFTISGSTLTNADISVAALPGFSYSLTSGGSYTSSLTIMQPGGLFSQQVFVIFTPVALQSYDGNIEVSGGGASSINVAATGAGNNNSPTLITGSASAVTINTATLAATINSIGCTAVTGYGIEYSLVNGFVNGTVVSASNLNAGAFSVHLSGLTPATTYYYKAFAINGGGTGYGMQQSFTTASPVLTATSLNAFGASCINVVNGPNSFTISSAGLTNANVNVGPLPGYSFSTSATGTYSNSLSLTQPGGAYSQIIFVKFTPVAVQSYNGNIPVSGGGANNINVAASGSGVNNAPTVTTGIATAITANGAMAAGTVSGIGCSNIGFFGIEYSSISGFANGHGIKVPASGFITGSDFSSILNGLVQGTTYYFKAYAANNGGIAYGTQQSFTTLSIPDGLTIYSSPIQRGGDLHYTLRNIKPSHYAAKIYNTNGQLIYRRDMILQVNFIDDHFTVPSNIGTGLYSLEIESLDFKVRKTFMIR